MSRPRYLWTSYFVLKSALCLAGAAYAVLHGMNPDPGLTVGLLSLFIGAPLFVLIETKCH